METLYKMLGLLVLGAVLGIIFVLPVVLGVKWAKRNRISPHWMWFGLYPLAGWVAFAIIRWGGQIDKVGEVSVKWVTGMVACPSCGKFNPVNNTSCANCGKAVVKPICPRCKSEKTRFVGRVGNYLVWGTLLMIFSGSAMSVGTQQDISLAILIGIALFVGSIIVLFMPLAKRTKRIKCLSCGSESLVTEVRTFQQLPTQAT